MGKVPCPMLVRPTKRIVDKPASFDIAVLHEQPLKRAMTNLVESGREFH